MNLADFFNDYNMAVLGVMTVVCIIIAFLFEKYMPLEPEMPKITDEKDPNLDKSREELLLLETPIKTKPMLTLADLSKNSGKPGEKAWVCNKGKIYDCSSNEVYRSEGGYNCFAGKDATLSLGKMEFELVG